MTEPPWGACHCGCSPADHDAVVLRPICIDPGSRVLFEGTLGACTSCPCDLYSCAAHVGLRAKT